MNEIEQSKLDNLDFSLGIKTVDAIRDKLIAEGLSAVAMIKVSSEIDWGAPDLQHQCEMLLKAYKEAQNAQNETEINNCKDEILNTLHEIINKAKNGTQNPNFDDMHLNHNDKEPSRGKFESEGAAIKAIAKIVGLNDDEITTLANAAFGLCNVEENKFESVKSRISDALNDHPELIFIILADIHENWMGVHFKNFDGISEKKRKVDLDGQEKIIKELVLRDKNYQFVFLPFMSLDGDGVMADLLFLKPILELCEVNINLQKIGNECLNTRNRIIVGENLHTIKDYMEFFANNPLLSKLNIGDTNLSISEYLHKNSDSLLHFTLQALVKSGIINENKIPNEIKNIYYNNPKTPKDLIELGIHNRDQFSEEALDHMYSQNTQYNAGNFRSLSMEGISLERFINTKIKELPDQIQY